MDIHRQPDLVAHTDRFNFRLRLYVYFDEVRPIDMKTAIVRECFARVGWHRVEQNPEEVTTCSNVSLGFHRLTASTVLVPSSLEHCCVIACYRLPVGDPFLTVTLGWPLVFVDEAKRETVLSFGYCLFLYRLLHWGSSLQQKVQKNGNWSTSFVRCTSEFLLFHELAA